MKDTIFCEKHDEEFFVKCPICIQEERDQQWIKAIKDREVNFAGVFIVSGRDVIDSMGFKTISVEKKE